jgi:hypothetical protein
MAKLADALALGASGEIRGGSTPPLPTEKFGNEKSFEMNLCSMYV